MHAAQAVFFLALLAVVIIAAMAWRHSRSTKLINAWARQSGFTILSAQRRLFSRGPFFLRSGKQQTVYHVTVRDGRGKTRAAYIRCGSWWIGLMSDDVKVEWDD
jgi:hypothetical protein